MKKRYISAIAITSLLLSQHALAIQVTVKSVANQVFGLGFSVNGKQYGGLGSSYSNNNVPVGNYQFGVRTTGDVGCAMPNGKKTIRLQKNTTVYLRYNGKNCTMQIASR